MIERYSRPEMAALWTQENRYRAWLRVELAVCEAWHEQGVIPAADMAEIRAKADIDAARIDEIETVTRHDVIAFLTSLEEKSDRPRVSFIWAALRRILWTRPGRCLWWKRAAAS